MAIINKDLTERDVFTNSMYFFIIIWENNRDDGKVLDILSRHYNLDSGVLSRDGFQYIKAASECKLCNLIIADGTNIKKIINYITSNIRYPDAVYPINIMKEIPYINNVDEFSVFWNTKASEWGRRTSLFSPQTNKLSFYLNIGYNNCINKVNEIIKSYGHN